jgi:soluble lytic murein transglycosylase-like protein
MPGTAHTYGLTDPFDAEKAIDAQAHLMSDLLRQFGGRPALALAAYNAGAGAVQRYGGVPPFGETRGYVARIMGILGGAGTLAVPTFSVRLVA